VILPARGRGIHSPLYIEDLIDGVLAASTSEAASGQVITLSGGDGVTTREYFGRIGAMVGRPRVPSAPTAPLLVLAGTQAAIDRLTRTPGEVNPNAIRYLTRSGTYSIEKAQRLLGFEPKVNLREGMRRSESWLRAEGML
jgi:nucleoside-diphosphate-sugar epimerase